MHPTATSKRRAAGESELFSLARRGTWLALDATADGNVRLTTGPSGAILDVERLKMLIAALTTQLDSVEQNGATS